MGEHDKPGFSPPELDRLEDALERLGRFDRGEWADDLPTNIQQRLQEYRNVLSLTRAALPIESVADDVLVGVLDQARQAVTNPSVASDVRGPSQERPTARTSWFRHKFWVPLLALAGTAALVLVVVRPGVDRNAVIKDMTRAPEASAVREEPSPAATRGAKLEADAYNQPVAEAVPAPSEARSGLSGDDTTPRAQAGTEAQKDMRGPSPFPGSDGRARTKGARKNERLEGFGSVGSAANVPAGESSVSLTEAEEKSRGRSGASMESLRDDAPADATRPPSSSSSPSNRAASSPSSPSKPVASSPSPLERKSTQTAGAAESAAPAPAPSPDTDQVARTDDTPWPTLQHADTQRRNGRCDLARAAYRRLLRHQGEVLARAHAGLGLCDEREANHTAAAQSYARARTAWSSIDRFIASERARP